MLLLLGVRNFLKLWRQTAIFHETKLTLKERWAGQSSPACVSRSCLHCPRMDLNTHFMTLLEQVVVQGTVQAGTKENTLWRLEGSDETVTHNTSWGGKIRNSFVVKDVKSFANLAQCWTIYLRKKVVTACFWNIVLTNTVLKLLLLRSHLCFPYVVRKHEVTQLMFSWICILHALQFSTCRSVGWNNICVCQWESSKLTEFQIILFCFCNENFAVWNKLWTWKTSWTSLRL